MKAGPWRLVMEGGWVTRTVLVEPGPGSGTERWRARAGLGHVATGMTPRAAVFMLARECGWWDVEELRGPGELTRAEAVAEMRDRAAQQAEKRRSETGDEIADEILALPLDPPPRDPT